VRSISDIKNIQINDDATTTRSAKVSEVKERTVLRTLLLKPALGKAKRHAMHNPKITISHLNFDDMERSY
jgi:hypothetical protein